MVSRACPPRRLSHYLPHSLPQTEELHYRPEPSQAALRGRTASDCGTARLFRRPPGPCAQLSFMALHSAPQQTVSETHGDSYGYRTVVRGAFGRLFKVVPLKVFYFYFFFLFLFYFFWEIYFNVKWLRSWWVYSSIKITYILHFDYFLLFTFLLLLQQMFFYWQSCDVFLKCKWENNNDSKWVPITSKCVCVCVCVCVYGGVSHGLTPRGFSPTSHHECVLNHNTTDLCSAAHSATSAWGDRNPPLAPGGTLWHFTNKPHEVRYHNAFLRCLQVNLYLLKAKESRKFVFLSAQNKTRHLYHHLPSLGHLQNEHEDRCPPVLALHCKRRKKNSVGLKIFLETLCVPYTVTPAKNERNEPYPRPP